MGMDELEDAKCGQRQGQPSQPQASPPNDEDDKSSRVDAAKAFFRAMYAGEEPPASFGQPAQTPATDTVCRKCESSELLAKEMEQKAAEAEQLYKRMAADFENYRKRVDREREESIALGVKKAAESLMPALDDLGRAMQFLSADSPSDKVIESFRLVGNRVIHCLDQVGVKKINAVGQQFDPKYHEPVQQIETSEYPDGVVMQELRPGYILNERVVRPALVNVASNPSGVVASKAGAVTAGLPVIEFSDAPEAKSPEPKKEDVSGASSPPGSAPASSEHGANAGNSASTGELEHTVVAPAAEAAAPTPTQSPSAEPAAPVPSSSSRSTSARSTTSAIDEPEPIIHELDGALEDS